MNNSRRADLKRAEDLLSNAQNLVSELLSDAKLTEANQLVEQAQRIVDSVLSEESDALDNIPENLQNGSLYGNIETNVEALEDIIDSFDDLSGSILSLAS